MALAWSPDGIRLATIGYDNSVHVWSAVNGTCLATMRVDSTLHCCAGSPVGHQIAAGGDSGVYVFTSHDS